MNLPWCWLSIKYLQTSKCPALAAAISGVTPRSGSGMLRSALASDATGNMAAWSMSQPQSSWPLVGSKVSNGFKDCYPILQIWDPSDHLPAWISSAATVKLPCSQRRTKHLAATVMPSKSGTCEISGALTQRSSGSFFELFRVQHDYQMITIYYTRGSLGLTWCD